MASILWSLKFSALDVKNYSVLECEACDQIVFWLSAKSGLCLWGAAGLVHRASRKISAGNKGPLNPYFDLVSCNYAWIYSITENLLCSIEQPFSQFYLRLKPFDISCL